MTTITDRQRKLANASRAKLADHTTPFIRNAWYAAALSEEVSRQPISRRIMGVSIMLFRTENGAAIALQDRCCHRSFPLSKGKLDGDTVVCGYHGLRYDISGKCIEIPMQEKPPVNIRVKSYRALERGPFIWLWMGDPEQADEAALPFQEWMDHPDWSTYIGYLPIKGNYVHMHENLLDLSHLSFLHEKTFGTPEYARAPIEERIDGDCIEVWRRVECQLPAIYAVPLGWEGMKVMRSSGSRYFSPGLHINTGILKNLELPEANQDPVPMVKVGQVLTPESEHATHYWYLVARNFAQGDQEVDAFMLKAQTMAFSEDAVAVESIANFQQYDGDPDFYEIDIATDRPGLAMRRLLKRLADGEARARG